MSTFNLDNLRWSKVIICTDADVDGFQIRTLILTMLYRLCPQLIDDGFVYIAMNAVYHAALTFVGQNMGAKKYKNIKKITVLCAICATVIGLSMAGVILLFKEFFVGLYISGNAAVAEAAYVRFYYIMSVYFLCGIMEVLCGALLCATRDAAPILRIWNPWVIWDCSKPSEALI